MIISPVVHGLWWTVLLSGINNLPNAWQQGGGIVWQLHATLFAGLLHTRTHIHHSHCGNHSDQCSPNYLKGLCLSESTTEREKQSGRQWLCVICVVALRLTVGVRYCRLLANSLYCTEKQWRARDTDEHMEDLHLLCHSKPSHKE